MTRRPLALLGAALLAAGCSDPYAKLPDPPEVALPPGELPAPPVPRARPRLAAEHLAPSPRAAARRAADLVGNWTGETVAARYARLAAGSIGQARDTARRAAAQLPTDPQLTAPGARGSSTIEAVVARRRGSRPRLLVVTRDRVEADNRTETRFRVTLAEAERLPGGWALSRWEPQP